MGICFLKNHGVSRGVSRVFAGLFVKASLYLGLQTFNKPELFTLYYTFRGVLCITCF